MGSDAFKTALAKVDAGDVRAVIAAGMEAVRAGIGEPVVRLLRDSTMRHPDIPQLWQIMGLAARLEQDSALALHAFSRAAALAPRDALIAQSHAQAALEAGTDATALFDQAVALAPQSGSVLLGRVAAQVSQSAIAEAVRSLELLLTENPLWIDGHRAFSKITGQTGESGDPRRTLLAARRLHPREPRIHQALVATDFNLNDYPSAEQHLDEARAHLPPARWIELWAAFCASELEQIERADEHFAALGPPLDVDEAFRLTRHHIRAGRIDQAATLAEPWVGKDPANLLWPYLALAWRLQGDPRWHWLEGDARFVQVYDLDDKLGSIDRLADVLRRLHFADRQPLDQSLRNGTQTDGVLLARLEPEIRRLRTAIIDTVKNYVAQLPEPDPSHPLLVSPRHPIRFSGSWSVRLTRQGFHIDHVHSQGWISSALYVALPGNAIGGGDGDAGHDGWLSLGECRDLVPGLDPVRLIEPKPSRLVLFPSTMWHGTRPFADGERLTVAFDVARPSQG